MLKKILGYCIVPIVSILIVIAFVSPVKAQDEKDIKIQQLEANLRLYDEALRELGAPTPEATALVWAKGIATRNGVMQYSVLNNKLKEEFKKSMEGQIWVTGTSSPWVVKYAVVDNKKTGDTYEITVEFTWATSAGPAGKTKSKLTILKEDGKWRISRYEEVNKG